MRFPNGVYPGKLIILQQICKINDKPVCLNIALGEIINILCQPPPRSDPQLAVSTAVRPPLCWGGFGGSFAASGALLCVGTAQPFFSFLWWESVLVYGNATDPCTSSPGS